MEGGATRDEGLDGVEGARWVGKEEEGRGSSTTLDDGGGSTLGETGEGESESAGHEYGTEKQGRG